MGRDEWRPLASAAARSRVSPSTARRYPRSETPSPPPRHRFRRSPDYGRGGAARKPSDFSPDNSDDEELKVLPYSEYRRLKPQKLRKNLKNCIWRVTPSPPPTHRSQPFDDGENFLPSGEKKEKEKEKKSARSDSDSGESSSDDSESGSENPPPSKRRGRKKRKSQRSDDPSSDRRKSSRRRRDLSSEDRPSPKPKEENGLQV